MNRVLPGQRRETRAGLPSLDNGDRMSQAEFHGRFRHSTNRNTSTSKVAAMRVRWSRNAAVRTSRWVG